MRASQGHWSRQGQGGTLGLWIPGYAMLRIKVPVPAPQWDFGTSGAEGQEESSVDRSREGKKKNIDWRNWLQTFGKGRRRRAERGKMNNTQGCQGRSPEGCSILRLRDTYYHGCHWPFPSDDVSPSQNLRTLQDPESPLYGSFQMYDLS